MLSDSIDIVSPAEGTTKVTIWSRRRSLPGGCLAATTQIMHAHSGWPLSLREFSTARTAPS